MMILVGLLSSCEKDEVIDCTDPWQMEVDTTIYMDRRDRYVGQYQFHTVRVHVWLDNNAGIQHWDTTLIDFLGEVWYDEPEKISFNYKDGATIDFTVGMDGSLYYPAYYPYYGQFQNNGSVSFSTRDGGLGSYYTQDVSGMKIQ